MRDLEALDGLLAALGHRDGATDRLQRQSRYVLAACIVFLGLALVFVKWGLPWAAALAASRLPPAVSNTLSSETLKLLDGQVLLPSRLEQERRRTLEREFHALRLPGGGRAASVLLFRNSPQLGANAFTLPDGSIILLDDLVKDLGDDRRILAVLAHELGHAHAHHGLRLLLQSSAIGALLVVYLGDVSNLLAGASAAVLQARYSQDFERQADDYAASVLSLNAMSPALLAEALEKLAAAHSAAAPPGYLSSHPPTDERIRHLRSRGSPLPRAH